MNTSTPGASGWRQTLDSYGGPAVIGLILLAIVVVLAIVFRSSLGFGSSDAATLGEVVVLAETEHVPDGALGPNPPLTPAGGPHYALPLRPGIYDQTVPDGNAIHSLEHGMVWVTYLPGALSEEDLGTLERVASEFSNDLILSPRPENAEPVIVVSWARRLVLDEVDAEVLRDYVTTNLNQSPEPGLR